MNMSNQPELLLSRRDQEVLAAIVEIYTRTAEPVSSSQLLVECGINCSSATVRNIMARLERDGFLAHPYTSAGKYPTYLAYHYFIRKMMAQPLLGQDIRRKIQLEILNAVCENDQKVKLTARVLAVTSELMAVAWISSSASCRLAGVQLMHTGRRQLLLVAFLDNGGVVHQRMAWDQQISKRVLDQVVKLVNDQGKGCDADELRRLADGSWQGLDQTIHHLFQQALLFLSKGLKQRLAQEDLILEGAGNLINQPEFDNILAARKTISALEQGTVLTQSLMAPGIKKGDITIALGQDDPGQAIPALSVISNHVVFKDGRHARFGIVGPRRMPYNRLVCLLEYTTAALKKSGSMGL